MARSYAKISTSLWRSRKFRALRDNDHARFLYLYLHTCSQVNSLGCFSVPIGYVEADLCWPKRQVIEAIDSLSKAFLVEWNEAEEVIRIVDFLDHDPPTNEKHAEALVRMADTIPDCAEKLLTLIDLQKQKHAANNTKLAEQIATQSIGYGEPSETPYPYPNPIPEPVDTSSLRPDVCAEPQSDSTPEVQEIPMIALPTNRAGEEFPVFQAQLVEFRAIYPAVDVEQELREIRGWLISNPPKRKTARGMLRFVNAWLAREQDKGHGRNEKTGATKLDKIFAGALDAIERSEPGADHQTPSGVVALLPPARAFRGSG